MTTVRARNIDHYEIDSHGIIRSPGKFEGCPRWVPAFWDMYLDGMADDETDTGWLLFNLMPGDIQDFPELDRVQQVAINEDEYGFVWGETILHDYDHKKLV